MPTQVYVSEGGFEFRFPFKRGTAVLDISSATAKECALYPPSGAVKVKTGADFVTDGTDGLLKYSTVAADIDEKGYWDIQGKIVLGGQEIFSSIIRVQAVIPLEDR